MTFNINASCPDIYVQCSLPKTLFIIKKGLTIIPIGTK